MATDTSVRLQGDRIYLRYLDESDVSQTYADWMNDTRINRYLESRVSEQTVDTVAAFIRTSRADPDVHLFGMFLNEDDRHVGNIKIGPLHPRYGTGDIGLLVGDPDVWGRGIGTEAIALISRFAFTVLGLRRVTAGAYARNAGCIRAFEKVGFSREGLLRGEVIGADGKPDDVVKMGLLAEELPA